MISCICRIPGVSSRTCQFVSLPDVNDTVFLRTSSTREEYIVMKREFDGYGYIDAPREPCVILVLGHVN